MENTKEISDRLKAKKIRPSMIRIKVLQFLLSSREQHPTADTIFKELSKDIPTLSKTSIYNTLRSFISAGVAREVMIEENEIRYDAFMDRHAHFKCSVCGKLMDIDLGCVSCANSGRLNDNKVVEERIYMVGICADCAKKGGEKENGKKIKIKG